ncbi:uncharacterized protein LOC114431644 [Parambassis ranga]|uniref:Uncharacterized protein LOC114431644 n=1 Tax=Parambassis ranga TaxID=210632 RepID=A0A6P7HWV7_9TELE|nr:uncharacterized protein LOC114431644 [Parambassis ranga]
MLGFVEKQKKNTGSEQEEKKRRKKLVDEMLHSIFFWDKSTNPPLEEIIPDVKIHNALKNEYPRPFEFCTSQRPKRTPIFYVLDMTVEQEKPENEEKINKTEGSRPTSENKCSGVLHQESSQESNSCNKYYGVSISTTGAQAGRIVVAASCFSAWDDDVARAVMTYYPNKDKRTYFDATITLPKTVRCEAFSIRMERNEEMMPCRPCANLFGLRTSDETEWAYGNCAEAESVSNLLKNEAKENHKQKYNHLQMQI